MPLSLLALQIFLAGVEGKETHALPPTDCLQTRGPCLTDDVSATALCRICEPIAFMSIFPYIYFMIRSFRITENEDQISFYAGLVTSAFALAEFSTGVLWGRLSDRIGRKPVLMAGLIGTFLSMLVFGFASSLPIALLGRALGGALNGYAPLSSALTAFLEEGRSTNT